MLPSLSGRMLIGLHERSEEVREVRGVREVRVRGDSTVGLRQSWDRAARLVCEVIYIKRKFTFSCFPIKL